MSSWTGSDTWFGDDLETAGFDDEGLTPGSTAAAAVTQDDNAEIAAASVGVGATTAQTSADQSIAAVAQVAIKSLTGARSLGLYWSSSWWGLNWWGTHFWAIPSTESTGISQTGNQTRGRYWGTAFWGADFWAPHFWPLSLTPGTHVTVSGALGAAPAGDLIAAAAGLVGVRATAALTAAGHTAASGGTLAIRASAVLSPSAHTLTAAGAVASAPGSVIAGLTVTQASQSLAAGGLIRVLAAVTATQSPDAVDASVATGAPASVTADVSVTQDDQTLSAVGIAVREQQPTYGGGFLAAEPPRPIRASLRTRQAADRIAVRGSVRDIPRSTATVFARGSSDTAGISATTSIHAHAECRAAGDSCIAAVHLDWHDLIAAEDDALVIFGVEGLLMEAA